MKQYEAVLFNLYGTLVDIHTDPNRVEGVISSRPLTALIPNFRLFRKTAFQYSGSAIFFEKPGYYRTASMYSIRLFLQDDKSCFENDLLKQKAASKETIRSHKTAMNQFLDFASEYLNIKFSEFEFSLASKYHDETCGLSGIFTGIVFSPKHQKKEKSGRIRSAQLL